MPEVGSGERLQAVTVCVDYGDFLECALPINQRWIDRWIVVTSTGDHETRALCEAAGVECVRTDRFYDDGADFNKAKGLNEGLKRLRHDRWILSLDADIVLTEDIRPALGRLDADLLHGSRRYLCRSRQDLVDYLQTGRFSFQPMDPPHRVFNGYYQLFHGCSPRLAHGVRYGEDSPDASGSDWDFRELWPETERVLLDAPVIHLGDISYQENWRGRVSPTF